MQTNWRNFHGSHFENKRALITGGAGFIGSHIIEALVALGADVVILDNLSSGKRENIDSVTVAAQLHPSNIRFEHGSILNGDLVTHAMQGIDYVFHQAAMASVPLSVERPREFYDVNVTGTINVLEAAAKGKVKRVMFAASSSAYGESETLPKIESMPPSPLSPYAASKVAGEGLMRTWAHCYGVDTASLRYFNIFGPRQTADSAYAAVIAAFAKAMLLGKQPQIFGDGEQSRDFTYVHNAVHANLLAARSPRPLAGDAINVACGQRVTLNELAKTMREALSQPTLTPIHREPRAGDVRHSLADLAHAKQILNYQPIVDFATGLRATLDWYRSTFS